MIGSKVTFEGFHDGGGEESPTACHLNGRFVGDRMDRLLVNGKSVGDIVSFEVTEEGGAGWPRIAFVTVTLIAGELEWVGPPPPADSPAFALWALCGNPGMEGGVAWRGDGDRKPMENTTDGSEVSRAS